MSNNLTNYGFLTDNHHQYYAINYYNYTLQQNDGQHATGVPSSRFPSQSSQPAFPVMSFPVWNNQFPESHYYLGSSLSYRCAPPNPRMPFVIPFGNNYRTFQNPFQRNPPSSAIPAIRSVGNYETSAWSQPEPVANTIDGGNYSASTNHCVETGSLNYQHSEKNYGGNCEVYEDYNVGNKNNESSENPFNGNNELSDNPFNANNESSENKLVDVYETCSNSFVGNYDTSENHFGENYDTSENHFAENYDTSENHFAQNYETSENHFAQNYETSGNYFPENYETSENHLSQNYEVSENKYPQTYETSENCFLQNYEASENNFHQNYVYEASENNFHLNYEASENNYHQNYEASVSENFSIENHEISPNPFVEFSKTSKDNFGNYESPNNSLFGSNKTSRCHILSGYKIPENSFFSNYEPLQNIDRGSHEESENIFVRNYETKDMCHLKNRQSVVNHVVGNNEAFKDLPLGDQCSSGNFIPGDEGYSYDHTLPQNSFLKREGYRETDVFLPRPANHGTSANSNSIDGHMSSYSGELKLPTDDKFLAFDLQETPQLREMLTINASDKEKYQKLAAYGLERCLSYFSNSIDRLLMKLKLANLVDLAKFTVLIRLEFGARSVVTLNDILCRRLRGNIPEWNENNVEQRMTLVYLMHLIMVVEDTDPCLKGFERKYFISAFESTLLGSENFFKNVVRKATFQQSKQLYSLRCKWNKYFSSFSLKSIDRTCWNTPGYRRDANLEDIENIGGVNLIVAVMKIVGQCLHASWLANLPLTKTEILKLTDKYAVGKPGRNTVFIYNKIVEFTVTPFMLGVIDIFPKNRREDIIGVVKEAFYIEKVFGSDHVSVVAGFLLDRMRGRAGISLPERLIALVLVHTIVSAEANQPKYKDWSRDKRPFCKAFSNYILVSNIKSLVALLDDEDKKILYWMRLLWNSCLLIPCLDKMDNEFWKNWKRKWGYLAKNKGLPSSLRNQPPYLVDVYGSDEAMTITQNLGKNEKFDVTTIGYSSGRKEDRGISNVSENMPKMTTEGVDKTVKNQSVQQIQNQTVKETTVKSQAVQQVHNQTVNQTTVKNQAVQQVDNEKTEQKVQDHLKVGETATDNQKVVQTASNNQKAVQSASNNQKAVQSASNNQKAVQSASNNQKAVQSASNNQRAVQSASNNQKAVQSASNNQKAVQSASNNQKAIQTAADNQKTAQTASSNQKAGQTFADNQEAVQTAADNQKVEQPAVDNQTKIIINIEDNTGFVKNKDMNTLDPPDRQVREERRNLWNGVLYLDEKYENKLKYKYFRSRSRIEEIQKCSYDNTNRLDVAMEKFRKSVYDMLPMLHIKKLLDVAREAFFLSTEFRRGAVFKIVEFLVQSLEEGFEILKAEELKCISRLISFVTIHVIVSITEVKSGGVGQMGAGLFEQAFKDADLVEKAKSFRLLGGIKHDGIITRKLEHLAVTWFPKDAVMYNNELCDRNTDFEAACIKDICKFVELQYNQHVEAVFRDIKELGELSTNRIVFPIIKRGSCTVEHSEPESKEKDNQKRCLKMNTPNKVLKERNTNATEREVKLLSLPIIHMSPSSTKSGNTSETIVADNKFPIFTPPAPYKTSGYFGLGGNPLPLWNWNC